MKPRNNKEVTINELALKVKEMTDSDSEIEHIPYEKAYGPSFEDMQRRCPSIKKVKNPGPQDLVLLLPPERGLGSCPLKRQEKVIPKGFIRN